MNVIYITKILRCSKTSESWNMYSNNCIFSLFNYMDIYLSKCSRSFRTTAKFYSKPKLTPQEVSILNFQ